MSSIHKNERPLSDEECELVSGGCFPIIVSDGHGGFILTSPTIDHDPKFPISTGPTFPTGTGPTSPFPA
jgi:hypothetical protein